MICQSLQRARTVLVYEKSHVGEVVYELGRLDGLNWKGWTEVDAPSYVDALIDF